MTLSVAIEIFSSDDDGIVLNLNGKTITFELAGIFDLYGNTQLIVTGNGRLLMETDTTSQLGYFFRLGDTANLIIKDGTYNAGMTCVQVGDNSSCTIESGYFDAFAPYAGKYWILNKIDNSETTFSVKGGTFVNFDPSNSGTENPTQDFMADGYTVQISIDGDKTIYTVVPVTEESAGEQAAN